MKKSTKIIISVLAVMVIGITSFLVWWYNGKTYKEFYAKATQEFQIPGLADGYTPQGLHYDTTHGCFMSSGYIKGEKEASRIYFITDNQTKYITLSTKDGVYKGHAGGVATYLDWGYVVGDDYIYIFNLTTAINSDNGEDVSCIAELECPNGADFVTVDDNTLFIGEFHRDNNYPTADSHKIPCVDGTNTAVTYAYNLDQTEDFGFDITTPDFAISTTSLIQGMTFADNDSIVLSESYGLKDSQLYVHKPLSQIEPYTDFEYNGTDLDLYILDSSNLLDIIEMPSMSEEIISYNGRIYVLFENACKKYKLVTRKKTKHVYSLNLADFE